MCVCFFLIIGEGTSQQNAPNNDDQPQHQVAPDDTSDDSDNHFENEAEQEEQREQERMYTITSRRQVNVARFNTVGQDIHIRMRPHSHTNNFEQVLHNMYKVFQQIIKDFIEPLPDNSYVRFVLISEDLETPISVRLQHKKFFTPEVIFTHIRNVIQSRKTFSIDGDLRINLVYTVLPEGRGPKRNSVKCFNKQSIISVCNGESDNMCLVNSLVIGMAMADKKPKAYIKKLKKKDHLLQERALKLMEECNMTVDLERSYSLNDVKKVQDLYKNEYQIIVVEKSCINEVIFLGPMAEKKVVLFHSNEHFDTVNNINGFFPHNYKLCFVCGKTYYNGCPHRECLNMCKICKGIDCDSKKEFEKTVIKWNACDKCNRHFPSEMCYKNHLTNHGFGVTCDNLKKCHKCNSTVPAYKLKPAKLHNCGLVYCKVCAKHYYRSEEHLCYVQPLCEKPKKRKRKKKRQNNEEGDNIENETELEDKKKVFYYDIETTTEADGKFVAMFLYFESEDGEVERIFRGKNAADDFCKEILTDESYTNSIFVAHNGGKFDNYFIVNFMHREGYKLDLVHSGGSVLFFKIQQNNIVFKDSYMFIPKRLADLPKTFSLENEVCKGYFPYLFPYPGVDQNYVGPYPDLKYFNADNMSDSGRAYGMVRREKLKW